MFMEIPLLLTLLLMGDPDYVSKMPVYDLEETSALLLESYSSCSVTETENTCPADELFIADFVTDDAPETSELVAICGRNPGMVKKMFSTVFGLWCLAGRCCYYKWVRLGGVFYLVLDHCNTDVAVPPCNRSQYVM